MTVPGSHPIIRCNLVSTAGWLWLGAKVKPHVFPGIAALGVEAETGGRLVAAMDHAIFATAVFRDAVDDAVLVPFHFLEQLGVARIVRSEERRVGKECRSRRSPYH